MKKTITYKEVKEKVLDLINGGVSPTPTPTGGSIEYSLDEKKIGKWLDGKDLYQKTFAKTFVADTNTIDVSALGIDTLVSIEGFFIEDSHVQMVGGFYSSDYCCTIFDSTKTELKFKNETWAGSGYVTIKYTKGA